MTDDLDSLEWLLEHDPGPFLVRRRMAASLVAELRALREVVEILGSLSVRANAFREHYERLLAAIAKAKAKEARGG